MIRNSEERNRLVKSEFLFPSLIFHFCLVSFVQPEALQVKVVDLCSHEASVRFFRGADYGLTPHVERGIYDYRAAS